MSALVLPCPSCRALNRVPRERLRDVPICSTCRAHLLGAPVALDAGSFDAVIGKTSLPIAIDFWAPWCGPCRTFAPTFAAAARELAGELVLAKVDTQAEPGLAARFSIQSIPTLVLVDKGAELRRISGALPQTALVQWLRLG